MTVTPRRISLRSEDHDILNALRDSDFENRADERHSPTAGDPSNGWARRAGGATHRNEASLRP
jgi:hypothetical protein